MYTLCKAKWGTEQQRKRESLRKNIVYNLFQTYVMKMHINWLENLPVETIDECCNLVI